MDAFPGWWAGTRGLQGWRSRLSCHKDDPARLPEPWSPRCPRGRRPWSTLPSRPDRGRSQSEEKKKIIGWMMQFHVVNLGIQHICASQCFRVHDNVALFHLAKSFFFFFWGGGYYNILGSEQNGRFVVEDISIKISPKYNPGSPFSIRSTWRRTSNKPLPETLMTQFTKAYICVTKPRRVKLIC